MNTRFVPVVLCIGKTTSLHFHTNWLRWDSSETFSSSGTSCAQSQRWPGRPGVDLEEARRLQNHCKFIDFTGFALFGRESGRVINFLHYESDFLCYGSKFLHCRTTFFVTGATFFTIGAIATCSGQSTDLECTP